MSAAPLRRPRTSTAVPTRATQPRERGTSQDRRHLRAVSAPEQARSLAPFAWTCVLIIMAALASVLAITTAMSEGAYERRDLKIEIAQLHQQRAALVSELEANSSPTYLAEAARGLGMEPHTTLGFVSLTDQAVLKQGE
ncbi:hypothetical protein [Demequina activiva]|uniref:Cell division protein FtsL n=1 Tax=Demequina activiva TaxID=1582364 RepID=A0A919UFZ3_9MICO|nr:hypothetical protein [Demequina activiva]GIG54282.1 hypothetical protein Dac01nite_10340 [Demequina activiva]